MTKERSDASNGWASPVSCTTPVHAFNSSTLVRDEIKFSGEHLSYKLILLHISILVMEYFGAHVWHAIRLMMRPWSSANGGSLLFYLKRVFTLYVSRIGITNWPGTGQGDNYEYLIDTHDIFSNLNIIMLSAFDLYLFFMMYLAFSIIFVIVLNRF